MATPETQMGSEYQAVSQTAVKLLREILEYQKRLKKLKLFQDSGKQDYLIAAYRREIQQRQEQLQSLPRPAESAPDPWDRRGR